MDKDIEMIQFHPAHVEVAELTEHEAKNFGRVPGSFQKLIELNQKSIQAVTLIEDGRILMMLGAILLWKGNAEFWLIPTRYAQECPLLFCKSVRKLMDSMAQAAQLHRIQALAIDDESHNNFMEFLGFQKEGTLKQYSDLKEDFVQWARLFPERN